MAEEKEVFVTELEARFDKFEKAMLQAANKSDAGFNRIEKKMAHTNARLRKGLEFRGFDRGSEQAFRNVEQRFTSLRGMLLGGIGTLGISFGASELIASLKADEEAARRLGAVLKTTGNAAGLSQRQIMEWADELEARTGRGADEIMTVAAQLATFTSIGRNEFLKAIEVADDLAATFGGDLQGNLDAVARALDDPIKGFGNLQKRGFALADSELKRVKAHLAAGEAAKAQGIILENLSKQVNGAAEATNQGLTKSLNDLKKTAEDAFKAFADQHGTAAAITALEAASSSLEWLGENLDLVGEAAQTLIIFLGTRYVVGMGLTATSTLATAAASVTAKGAIEALNVAMAANPAAVIAVGVAALSFTIIELDRRMQEGRVATVQFVQSTQALAKATEAYAEAASVAAGETGREAKIARDAAAAKRAQAEASLAAARAKLEEARATVILIEAEAQKALDLERRAPLRGDRPGSTQTVDFKALGIARANVEAMNQAIAEASSTIAEADRILKTGGSTGIEYEAKGDDGTAKKAEARRRALEDMRAEIALQEATLTNDLDKVRVLEREAAVRQRTRALIDAEITKDRAAAAEQAEAVQKRLDAAREVQIAEAARVDRRAQDRGLWEIDERPDMIRKLEREMFLEERISFWQANGRDLITATSTATSELLELDQARAEAAQRNLKLAQEEHALTIAQLSGNDRLAKQLQDQAAIRERTKRYQEDGYALSATDAEGRATREVTRERQAATYGEHKELFASAFSDGIRAALSGDLQGFLSDQFGNFADTMFKKAGEQIYDAAFGGVSAVTEGAAEGTAIASVVTPAIVGAGATAGAAMATAITAAGAAAGATMAAAIASANAATSFLPGFSEGGWTGPGGMKQPKGVVHAGEVVWSQRDIARAGGVGTVEAMRRGLAGYDAGGIVGRRTAVDQVHAGLRSMRTVAPAQPAVVKLIVDEGAMFAPRVQAISGQVSVQTTATGVAYSQDQARTATMRRRQSLI